MSTLTKPAALRRSLGAFDLAFMQVLFIVQPTWIGVAATAGRASIPLWIGAIITFYVPLAVVVTALTATMPDESGPYEWAQSAFGDLASFLVAWYIWLSTVTSASLVGLEVAGYLSYCIGHPATPQSYSFVLDATISCVCVVCMTALTAIGLSIGKRLNIIAGMLLLLMISTLGLSPLFGKTTHSGNPSDWLALIPSLSTSTLNTFSKLAFGALSGFEMMAVLARESRNPRRSLTYSVVIAAPVIAGLYIFGTNAVVANFASSTNLDLIATLPQAFNAFGVHSITHYLSHITAPILLIILFGKRTLMFMLSSRFPMILAMNGALPQSLSRIDHHFRTPVNSILVVGGFTSVLAIAAALGAERQEAFQLLLATGIFYYAISYLFLFSIPLFRADLFAPRQRTALRCLSASGLLTTLMYLAFAVFPITGVSNKTSYATKLLALALVCTLLGVAVYVRYKSGRSNNQAGLSSM